MYECLTGEIPFRRDNQAALVYAHLMAQPPKVTEVRPHLPQAIDGVVAKGMAKKPQDRYATAGELIGDAKEALGPETAASVVARRPVPSKRRGPVALGAGAAIVAVAVVLAAVLLRGSGTPGPSSSSSSSPGVAAASDRVTRISQARADANLARLLDVKVGKGPKAVAVSEESVWVANEDDGTVSRIDPATNQVRVIEVGKRPGLIAVGEGSVWVANRLSRSVSRIDPGTNTVKATIDLEGGAVPDSLAVGEGAIWLSASGFSGGGSEIHKIDPDANRDVATITFSGGGLWSLLATGEGSVWVVSHSGGLIRLDPDTNEQREVAMLGVPAAGVTMADGKLWISTLQGEVLKVDPGTGIVEARVAAGGSAGGIASAIRDATFDDLVPIVAGNGIIWVTNKLGGTIDRIVMAGVTRLGSLRTGSTPTGVAVGFDSLWVTVCSRCVAPR
jgi:YVTN family beta-propeller protein